VSDAERLRKRKLQRLGARTYNRVIVFLLKHGLGLPPYSSKNALVMETVGRKSRKRRLIPMGYLRDAPDRLLVVAEHGHRADWVRNALSAGSVRVGIGRAQHRATIQVLDQADPEEVLERIGSEAHTKTIRRLGHDSRVVEIRLERP
jgi:deazaflavin-dependent oxidoreductase (nitroreductase family)